MTHSFINPEIWKILARHGKNMEWDIVDIQNFVVTNIISFSIKLAEYLKI